MQGLIRCVLVTGFLIGCHGDDTTTPDAPISGDSGLIVEWSSQPASWPADLGDTVTIERARFAFDRLRVIGDAGPGDPRTTATAFEVRWAWDSEQEVPEAIVFNEAPTGLYSQVSMQIDGHLVENSYEIRGTVNVSGTDWEYRIDDVNALALDVGIAEMLMPGSTVTVRLRVNFQHALDTIDWASLPVDEGRLELDETSVQMPAFRQKLTESFEIVNVAATR